MTGKSLKKALMVTLLSAFGFAANADQVVLDDQIVKGSTCVGSACVDGEDFGFDSVLIKEDDPSILFQDTSASSSF
ncbi:hypothetical protein QWI17_20110, partial [Gilvimarinus sp. SDUM040013]|nr:hypothetical protein [Gilvimarinus sp. SDUM040013]